MLHIHLIIVSIKPILDYIDNQFENYLQEELKMKRSMHTFHDTRVHVCLYFIAPTGHRYVINVHLFFQLLHRVKE